MRHVLGWTIFVPMSVLVAIGFLWSYAKTSFQIGEELAAEFSAHRLERRSTERRRETTRGLRT